MVFKILAASVISMLPIAVIPTLNPHLSEPPKITKQENTGKDVATFFIRGQKIVTSVQHDTTKKIAGTTLEFRRAENGSEVLAAVNGGWEGFQPPVFFKQGIHNFVYVATNPAGSGGFQEETVFWISPNFQFVDVNFRPAAEVFEEQAAPDEIVLAGTARTSVQTGGELSFHFYVARKGDPHCCPTGGRISGMYTIEIPTRTISDSTDIEIIPHFLSRASSVPSDSLKEEVHQSLYH